MSARLHLQRFLLPQFVSMLWSVKGFRDNLKARLWHEVAICEIRGDAFLSVCACRPPLEALCVVVLLARS